MMAYWRSEAGHEVVRPLFPALMSSVNALEVVMKVAKTDGVAPHILFAQLEDILEIVEFTNYQSRIAASIISLPGRRPLSLADRACLATAIALDRPVYTSDRHWAELDIDADVRLIR